MDHEKYLFKLQQEYLEKSKHYMDLVREGISLSQLKEFASELRCLITEIRAVKEDIDRNKRK
jgi:hypothetical protein